MIALQVHKQAEVILQPVSSEAGEDAASQTSTAAAGDIDGVDHGNSVPVDDSMIGDVVRLGDQFEGILFEISPTYHGTTEVSVAKVALTDEDGGYLDIDLYTATEKLAAAEPSSPQPYHTQEDAGELSPPQQTEEEAELAAIGKEFSTLLQSIEAVRGRARAAAT